MSDANDNKPTQVGDEGGKNPGGNLEPKAHVVPRETYDRAINDVKKLRARLNETETKLTTFEQEQREAEDMRQREQGEWKLIAEQKEQEAQQARKDRQEALDRSQKVLKRAAVQQVLQGVRGEYLDKFVDYDAIELDDNLQVVQSSLEDVAKRFRSSYPEILPKPQIRLPDEAAQKAPDGKKFLPFSEWIKLSDQEKAKTFPDKSTL